MLDTSHPAYKTVTAVRHSAVSYWKELSLPFPEPGVRLIRQDDVEAFDARMTIYRGELELAVAELDRHYDLLRQAARNRLGSLYNRDDYPVTLLGLFALAWEFPSVEPPEYLRELSPELFREEQERVMARFDEAVQLAEQAFLSELGKLVGHLTERLSGAEDGRPKVFRDSAIDNFREFFDRFRRLNVRSSSELDDLVASCRRAVGDIDPQDLRDRESLRTQVVVDLGRVQSTVDNLLVDRPRRNILRRPR